MDEYAVDCNATQAAKRAGFSAKAARQQGARLLSYAAIARAIAAGEAARFVRLNLQKDRILQEVLRIGLQDPRGYWHATGKRQGTLKRIDELTADQAACLAGFEAIIKNAAAGDGLTDLVHKVKFWDKPQALELLMKHLGLFADAEDQGLGSVFVFPPGTTVDVHTKAGA